MCTYVLGGSYMSHTVAEKHAVDDDEAPTWTPLPASNGASRQEMITCPKLQPLLSSGVLECAEFHV